MRLSDAWKSGRAQRLGGGSLSVELLRGFAGSFLLKLLNALLNLALSVFLARSLTPQGLGTYAFAFSVMTLLAVPVQLGLPTLLVREVARYQLEGQWGLLRGILLWSNQLVLFLSSLLGLAGALIWLGLPTSLGGTQLATHAWTFLLLPLVALNRLREAILQGLRRVVIAQVPDKILLPAVYILLLALVHMGGAITPAVAMALYCASAAVALLMGAVMLVRSLPPAVRVVRAQHDTRHWARSLLPLSLLFGLSVVNAQTDIFMLGLLSTSEEVGLYRVAFSGAALVLFLLTAVNSVTAPQIARLHGLNDRVRLQRVVTASARLTFLASLPIAGALIFFGGPILEAVFGPVYVTASPALAILGAAQLINVSVGSVHVVLNMLGFERETLVGAAYAIVLNIVLNAVLIPSFGMLGAAVATGVSIVAVNLVLLRVLWLRTGIWSFAF